jgi:hypothetical protein
MTQNRTFTADRTQLFGMYRLNSCTRLRATYVSLETVRTVKMLIVVFRVMAP